MSANETGQGADSLTGSKNRFAGGSVSSIVDQAVAPVTELPGESFFRNCYAVLVRGRTVRRHLYFNLPAAERSVKRALARGDAAELILVRLVPVDTRHLDTEVGE